MAKEVKKVKCKECKLTYDKKLHKCPYCQKKRFNPTGLIIFLIIIVIAIGTAGFFYREKIKEFINNKQNETVLDKNDDKGLIFKNISITKSEKYDNVYTVKFDIINNTGEAYNKNFVLKTLVDKVSVQVLQGNFIYWSDDYERITLNMIADEIYKAEYNIMINDKWQTLEIYLREPDNETGGINDIKVFTYQNELQEMPTETTAETTTQVRIITEQ